MTSSSENDYDCVPRIPAMDADKVRKLPVLSAMFKTDSRLAYPALHDSLVIRGNRISRHVAGACSIRMQSSFLEKM